MNRCAICTARIEPDTELCELCCKLQRTQADLRQQKTGQRDYAQRVAVLAQQTKAGNDERT